MHKFSLPIEITIFLPTGLLFGVPSTHFFKTNVIHFYSFSCSHISAIILRILSFCIYFHANWNILHENCLTGTHIFFESRIHYFLNSSLEISKWNFFPLIIRFFVTWMIHYKLDFHECLLCLWIMKIMSGWVRPRLKIVRIQGRSMISVWSSYFL